MLTALGDVNLQILLIEKELLFGFNSSLKLAIKEPILTYSSPDSKVPLSPKVHTNGLYEAPMHSLQIRGSSTTGKC